MPWYFSATSPFNFTQAFASSSDGRPLSSGGYFPPYPPQQQQPAQHFAPHQQPAPPPPSFHPSLPQQQQPQQHQPTHHAPWQSSSTHSDPHPSFRPAPTFLAPAPPRTQTFDPRAHPSSISPPTVDRRLSNVASSVPPGLMRDNSSSRSSLSSTSSAASSQLGPAQLLPMYVDMSLVDGRPTHKTAPTEIQPGDDDDDGGHAIVAFPTEPPPGRRSTRKPAVVDHEMRDDVDAEGEDEDDGEGEGEGDEDDHVSETESVASSSSSYNGGRVRKSSASSSTFKRKPKSATQPLPPSVSASAKSSPGTTSAKRRASAPSHLQPSRAPTDATSPPPSPLKRARPTPSLAIRYEDDELSLPPLPADFDSYGPGGSSRFTDDQGSGGGIAIPDFSGREDCWGIGKEAYQQLSAKAKKQLRSVSAAVEHVV